MLRIRTLSLAAIVAMNLIACGDDSTTATPAKQATLTADNANTYSLASAVTVPDTSKAQDLGGAMATIASSMLSQLNQGAPSTNVQPLAISGINLEQELRNTLAQAFTNCGGSLSVSDQSTPDASVVDVTVSFNQYCLTFQNVDVFLNGSMAIYNASPSTIASIEFNQLSVYANGQGTELNCGIDIDYTTFEVIASDCNQVEATPSPVTGANGEQGIYSNLDIKRQQDGSYTIDGTITGPDGYVSVSTTRNIIFDNVTCPAGQPVDGEVKLSGSNNSGASIDFNTSNCNTATLCLLNGETPTDCSTLTILQ